MNLEQMEGALYFGNGVVLSQKFRDNFYQQEDGRQLGRGKECQALEGDVDHLP
jgi:hypothetical protein